MSEKKPNIIFLMTDQHRWDGLGCLNPIVKTPNLDALASDGILFDQAVCNVPMCVPSRYSMMTGIYGSQGGFRHNIQYCPTDDDLPLPVIPQRLKEMGYRTAGFGKTHWYLGASIARGLPSTPSTRGFEIRAQARARAGGHMEPGAVCMEEDIPEGYARLSKETNPYGSGQENVLGYTGCTSAVPSEEHREGWLTNQALKFLDEGLDPDRPLFFYLSFDNPHAGYNVPEGYEDLYDIDDIPDRPMPDWTEDPVEHVGRDYRKDGWLEKTPEERRRTTLRYWALCSYVDDLFGRALRKLREKGVMDDALVLFTSDHGEMLGDRQHRFSKYCLYEGSIRVPLIVSGTSVPADRRGTTDHRPAELVDVLPTILDVAGEPVIPELPGRSLFSAPCRTGTFTEMHGGYEDVQKAPAYAWRTGNWKLILYLDGTTADALTRTDEAKGELYHLAEDPHEWNNLFDDPAAASKREELTRQLLMHVASAFAKYPRQTARSRLE
jgi:arylsulfatase A-like enzyme